MCSVFLEQEIYVPDTVAEEAKDAVSNLLPVKSKEKYKKEFEQFNTWRRSNGIPGINEHIVLTYFSNMTKAYKASSLWSRHSMLKSTLIVHENVDISKFMKVISYLKVQGRRYRPKKAHILYGKHMEQFFIDALDDIYLMMKVALLFGISGACRFSDLQLY